MIYNYFTSLPEELIENIWRSYFQNNVVSEIKLIISAKKWEKPSKQLCLLCNDIGCLQQGDGIDNTMDVLFKKDPIYYEDPNKCKCTNCELYGWPCLNHAIHTSDRIGVSSIWSIGNKEKLPLSDEFLNRLKHDKDTIKFKNLWY